MDALACVRAIRNPQSSVLCHFRTVRNQRSSVLCDFRTVRNPRSIVLCDFRTVRNPQSSVLCHFRTVRNPRSIVPCHFRAVRNPRSSVLCRFRPVPDPRSSVIFVAARLAAFTPAHAQFLEAVECIHVAQAGIDNAVALVRERSALHDTALGNPWPGHPAPVSPGVPARICRCSTHAPGQPCRHCKIEEGVRR